MKLSVAQADLLVRVKEQGGRLWCSDGYRPAQKLVALGLCDWASGKFGGTFITLTAAGQEELDRRK